MFVFVFLCPFFRVIEKKMEKFFVENQIVTCYDGK